MQQKTIRVLDLPEKCTSSNLLTDGLSVNKNTAEYETFVSCLNCDATNAVDKNIDTCTRTNFEKTSPAQHTWWYVDLGDVRSIYNIRIQFRDYGHMYGKQTIIKSNFQNLIYKFKEVFQ